MSVNGVSLHYHRAGSGRPLLLLHGLVGSAVHHWKQNISFLARHATVYAIDFLNMWPNRSAFRDSTPAWKRPLIRVEAWMDAAMGLDEADVAGHSHGGALAMMLAARDTRERVRRLILFAPAKPLTMRPRSPAHWVLPDPRRRVAGKADPVVAADVEEDSAKPHVR